MAFTIACDNAGIAYSPYNWDVTSGRAASINAGAYFYCTVSGATGFTLNFDMTSVSSPVPRIKVRVDGTGWTAYDTAATVALTLPGDNTWGVHHIEVLIASTSAFVNRWSPQDAIVKFTGITCTGTSGATRTVIPLATKVLIFGDSLVEGYKSVKDLTTPDGTDSQVGWAYQQRNLLGVEAGLVGFGAQGWTHGGDGGVPALPSTYNLLWGSGPARSFTSPAPDLIVLNMGTNDSTSIVALATSFFNTLIALNGTTRIAVMRPFNGSKESELQTSIAACNSPGRVAYIDTTGWHNASDGYDALHPEGFASLASMGPRLANALRPLLSTRRRFVNQGGVAVAV
jgi:lysophospholipase L1-like esterase